jgi:hypothetical protein
MVTKPANIPITAAHAANVSCGCAIGTSTTRRPYWSNMVSPFGYSADWLKSVNALTGATLAIEVNGRYIGLPHGHDLTGFPESGRIVLSERIQSAQTKLCIEARHQRRASVFQPELYQALPLGRESFLRVNHRHDFSNRPDVLTDARPIAGVTRSV